MIAFVEMFIHAFCNVCVCVCAFLWSIHKVHYIFFLKENWSSSSVRVI